MTPRSPYILIADDHPLFRLALKEAVQSAIAGAEIGQTSSLADTADKLSARGGADLLLLDLMMPGANGFSGLLFLRAAQPETPIAIVSGIDDARIIRKAMRFGASGYIPKSLPPARISEAIAAIFAGETWTPDVDIDTPEGADAQSDLGARLAALSAQQFRVLRLIGEGKLNKEIAHDLDLSLSTVKAHTTVLLKKLGFQRRTQLLAAMQTLDLADYPKSEPL